MSYVWSHRDLDRNQYVTAAQRRAREIAERIERDDRANRRNARNSSGVDETPEAIEARELALQLERSREEHAAAIEQQQLDQEEINEQAALWESAQARRAVPLPDEPDVPLPPAGGIAGRLSDTAIAASRLPVAAWDWLRRRAAVAREDALIRDGGDVPIDREDDTQACMICTVNKRAVILLPCGHCTLCNGCWQQWMVTIDAYGDCHGAECPDCRAQVQHTLPITQRQRDALSAETRTLHAGSRAHRLPAGPIYMRAQMPGAPLPCMHSLLDGLSA